MFKEAYFLTSLTLVLIAAPLSAAEIGEKLNEAEIKEALVGHKISAKPPQGKKWGATFAEDGTVKYSNGKTGTWSIKNGQFCDFPADDKEYCRTVVKVGDRKVQMLREDGSKGSLITY